MLNTASSPGRLFVVSAPSGAGKTTISSALLGRIDNLWLSVSHTTRDPRPKESHEKDYLFVDDKTFDDMVEQGEFIEWANVHGNRYGTSKKQLQSQLDKGHDILLELDWQGAKTIKEAFPGIAILVFVMPPSIEALQSRLIKRAQDSDAVIETRLHNSQGEIAQFDVYDYIIINKTLDEAIANFESIIQSHRLTKAYRYDEIRTLVNELTSHELFNRS